MKKSFVLMILVFTSFSMFAQLNYDESSHFTFSTTPELITDGSGHMERHGSSLTLDGRELSDAEVRELVGAELFETYLSAKTQINTSKTLTSVFIVSGAAAVALFFVSVASQSKTLLYVTGIPALVASASLPVMCIYGSIGKGRMGWVAEEFNKQGASTVSYSVSPSLIRCNTLPEQAYPGLGMTFNINF